jgi:hypothetical protein
MNHIKGKSVIVAGLLLTFMLFAAACATNQQTTGSAVPTIQGKQANAKLGHVPTGTSDLKWDAATQTLTVKIRLTGLAPKSTHPGHIHKGDCSVDGAVVFPLNPVVADDTGVGTSETTITGDTKGLPDKAWYINIHDGPTLGSAAEAAPITCGNIVNPNASTSSDQSLHVALGVTPGASQAASGDAKLLLVGDKLTVKISLGGLAPHSTHVAHIHKGSCEIQGGVKYPLNPVVADADGNGTSTTTVDNVTSIPKDGWYVNIHLGGPQDDLKTQTADDPVACGNVVVG